MLQVADQVNHVLRTGGRVCAFKRCLSRQRGVGVLEPVKRVFPVAVEVRDSRDDMTIRLSRLARQDLDDIRRYRVETWGRDQWLKYCRGLVRAFEGIAANPDGGRDRNLFAPGLRSVNYRQHVIFFARVGAAGDAPVILRIVHQRRHMPALIYFEDLDG